VAALQSALVEFVDAGVLSVGYETRGDPAGWPVVLLHGFPYDAHAYSEVSPRLAAEGARVIVPYLRGFGPTRFLSAETPRSGQQAALGADLVALLDAMGIESAVLAGYDWGGRAACVVAALWPHRVIALVSGNGYDVQDIARAGQPAPPDQERAYWYQYYLHGERGRAGLAVYRREFCELLWQLWSPTWSFDEATFERTATSFDNPDFVDVVVHSYRHRYGLVAGDPSLEEIETLLAAQPPIPVPTLTLDGAADGVFPAGDGSDDASQFTGWREHRVLPTVGHNLPQEAPVAFADAVLAVHHAALSETA
jgi:pimeloyl-ACP methyl ester carboxylesterase